MRSLLQRGVRARPGWVLALAVVLALHCVCVVCLAAASSAEEAPDSLALKVASQDIDSQALGMAENTDGAGLAGESENGAAGSLAAAIDHEHDCDASLLYSVLLGDSGNAAPSDIRASTALLVMLLLGAAALGALLWPPSRRGTSTPRPRMPVHVWRPSGFTLLTSLCIQRV